MTVSRKGDLTAADKDNKFYSQESNPAIKLRAKHLLNYVLPVDWVSLSSGAQIT